MKTKFTLLLLSITLFSSIVYAQKLTSKSERARDLYLKGSDNLYLSKYDEAEEFLVKSTQEDDKFVEAYLLLGDLYNQQKDYPQEEKALLIALKLDSTFFIPTFYNLGISQFHQGKYDEAIINLEKYKSKTKDNDAKTKADKSLANIKFSKYAIGHPIQITPISLGDNINSTYDEYWPSLRGDEQELVFTVLVPRDSILSTQRKLPRLPKYFHEDFYVSKRDSSTQEWQKRYKLSSNINTLGNEGAQSLSVDGKWMFFTACGRVNGKGSCDIFFSTSTPDGWSTPIDLDYPINTAGFEGQPCFSADGKTLFFVSSRSGGEGGLDIWAAQIVGSKPDGTPIFGNLINMGNHINSHGDENSPYIHPDGKTLYFSSDGWTGMGQMDIFLSRLQPNNEWSLPVNFGYPTNTAGDEIGFVLNSKGDRGYFSSSRYNNGDNGKDLYSFLMPDTLRPTPASYLKGRVFDFNTKEQLSASFELLNLSNSELAVQSTTNYKGEFLICLPIGINYALNVSKTGYLFYSQNVNLSKSTSVTEPMVADIYLKAITINASVVLENIFFDTNSAKLLPESLVELSKLLAFLQNNPSVKIELSGHTDNKGTESLNKTLSLQRAQSVQKFLTEKGITPIRLKAIGYGYTQPITTNNTEAGRAKNRRTEMKITE